MSLTEPTGLIPGSRMPDSALRVSRPREVHSARQALPGTGVCGPKALSGKIVWIRIGDGALSGELGK